MIEGGGLGIESPHHARVISSVFAFHLWLLESPTQDGDASPTGMHSVSLTSARPLQVEYRAGRLWVTDLGSKAGSWVDGVALDVDRPVSITRESKVKLGDVQFKMSAEIKEPVRKERRDKGEGDDFTENLAKSVFRRKKEEDGHIKEAHTEQRRKRKKGSRKARDEFGRR